MLTDRFERPKHDNDSGKHDNDSDKDSIERLKDYNERPKHDNDSVKDANESYKVLNDSPEDNAAPLTAYISQHKDNKPLHHNLIVTFTENYLQPEIQIQHPDNIFEPLKIQPTKPNTKLHTHFTFTPAHTKTKNVKKVLQLHLIKKACFNYFS